MGVFQGHTPRQHRASSSKGGRRRMLGVTREQLQEWGRRRQQKLREKRKETDATLTRTVAESGRDHDMQSTEFGGNVTRTR